MSFAIFRVVWAVLIFFVLLSPQLALADGGGGDRGGGSGGPCPGGSWASGSSGNWSDANNWNVACVPNGAAEFASLANGLSWGTNITTSLDQAATVDSLQVADFNALKILNTE